jgi:hypothetical protein
MLNTIYGKLTKSKTIQRTQDMLHQIKRVSIFRIPIFSLNLKILNHQVCLLDMHQISRGQIHVLHLSLQAEHNFGVA